MTIPIIDYACTVWGSFSLNSIGTIVRRLENAAARAITGNYDYVNMRGNVLFDDIRLVRFTDRYK